MDKKEKQKTYYQENRERIQKRQKNIIKIIKKKDKIIIKHIGRTTVDHQKKYQEMKEYYKEHSKKNYEKYGKDYYIKNKDIINEKYEQYRKDYYLKNQNNIHQKYVNRHYNIFIHNNDNKNFTVYFN